LSSNWEFTKDEIINKVDLVTQKQAERRIQNQVKNIFNSLQININRISETSIRTSDYEGPDLDIEVTAVHQYLPRIKDVEKAIRENKENNGQCTYSYIYLDDSKKPVFRIIKQTKLNENASILIIRQHFSMYKRKIISKIDDKYRQNTTNPNQIIVLDFRTAPFDNVTIKKGIHNMFLSSGQDYSQLIGIIAAVPKEIDSKILDEPEYFFIQNTHVNSVNVHNLNKLLSISKIQTSYNIMPMAIFVNFRYNIEIPIDECINSYPDIQELEKMGLPV
jgi:hypothetical protein